VSTASISVAEMLPMLSSLRWMARAARTSGAGPEMASPDWVYLETEIGRPVLGSEWDPLVREVYRDAYEHVVREGVDSVSAMDLARADFTAAAEVLWSGAQPMPTGALVRLIDAAHWYGRRRPALTDGYRDALWWLLERMGGGGLRDHPLGGLLQRVFEEASEIARLRALHASLEG
jgi:hypothetical protein